MPVIKTTDSEKRYAGVVKNDTKYGYALARKGGYIYYKYADVRWQQPTLRSNGTMGGGEFAVWRESTNGGYSNEAWQAVANQGGWGGYYIGNYGDEYSTTLYLHLYVPVNLTVTGYQVYSPTINSNSAWNSIGNTYFYGSNTDDNWTELHSTGEFSQDYLHTFSFTNSTPYRYYLYAMRTKGWDYRDQANISSFTLIGTYKALTRGTASDYDYKVENNIYYV